MNWDQKRSAPHMRNGGENEPVGVLDGGIVLLDEDALDELNGQSRFANTSRTQHDELERIHSF